MLFTDSVYCFKGPLVYLYFYSTYFSLKVTRFRKLMEGVVGLNKATHSLLSSSLSTTIPEIKIAATLNTATQWRDKFIDCVYLFSCTI